MSHNNPISTAPTTTPLKVAVLSDDSLLSSALASLIGQEVDVEVTQLKQADVALWDPGADISKLADKLAELSALDAPTVALLPDAGQAQRALGAGAKGVMLRDQVGPQLISALRAVRGGLTVMDGALADGFRATPGMPEHEPIEELTAREKEVIALLAEGLSNKDIASVLEISEHTAKFHIGRILTKLDADSRTEAVVRALRYGLLEL